MAEESRNRPGRVRRRQGRWFAVLAAVSLAGCGTPILKADFAAFADGTPGTGSIAGSPAGDQIRPGIEAPLVTGGELLFAGPGQQRMVFLSREVGEPDARKSIFWIGRFRSGEGPFFLTASATDPTFDSLLLSKGLRFEITASQMRVFDLAQGLYLHDHALNPAVDHRVFVSFQLKSAGYRISVQQPDTPEFELAGTLVPANLEWLTSKKLVALDAGGTYVLGRKAEHEYAIREVIIREYK